MGDATRESERPPHPDGALGALNDLLALHRHVGSERGDEDTVQTILARAKERARKVEQHCHPAHPSGLRAPTAGPQERIDPKRLAHVRPAPRHEDEDEEWMALPIALRR